MFAKRFTKTNALRIAQRLAKEAQRRSKSVLKTTPFELKFNEMLMKESPSGKIRRWKGGKIDDIGVVVAFCSTAV
jgi:hypothetical protein